MQDNRRAVSEGDRRFDVGQCRFRFTPCEGHAGRRAGKIVLNQGYGVVGDGHGGQGIAPRQVGEGGDLGRFLRAQGLGE